MSTMPFDSQDDDGDAHRPSVFKSPILFALARSSGGDTAWRAFPTAALPPIFRSAPKSPEGREAFTQAMGDGSALDFSKARLSRQKLGNRECFFAELPPLAMSTPVAMDAFDRLGQGLAGLLASRSLAVPSRPSTDGDDARRAILAHPDVDRYLRDIDEAAGAGTLRSATEGDAISTRLLASRMRATHERIKAQGAAEREARMEEIRSFTSVNAPESKAPILALRLRTHGAGSRAAGHGSLLAAQLPLPEGSSDWASILPRDQAGADALLAMAKAELRARQVQALAAGQGSLLQRDDWISGLKIACAGGRWMVHGLADTQPISTLDGRRPYHDQMDELCALAGDAIAGLPRARTPLDEKNWTDPKDYPTRAPIAIALIEKERSNAKISAIAEKESLGSMIDSDRMSPLLALLEKIDMDLALGAAGPKKISPSL